MIDPEPQTDESIFHVDITPGIANRLFQLLSSILADGATIPAMYHPIILNLVKPYLKKTSDSDLSEMILKLKDEIIPWILYGDKN